MKQQISNIVKDDEYDEEGTRKNVVKANFASLFSGMPGIQDILGSSPAKVEEDEAFEDTSEEDASEELSEAPGSTATTLEELSLLYNRPTRRKTRRKRLAAEDESDDDEEEDDGEGNDPDAWFEAERQRITQNYDEILQEILLDLEQGQNPADVPDNAVALIESVLKQEMEDEIRATKEQMQLDDFNQYEEEQNQMLQSDTVTKSSLDQVVQTLIDVSENEYSRKATSQLEQEEFLLYEREASKRIRAETQRPLDDPGASDSNEYIDDLDAWALAKLEEMAARRSMDDDDSQYVADNLEESVYELRKDMETVLQRKPPLATDLKDYQMYRSIATRLVDAEVSLSTDRVGDSDAPGGSRKMAQQQRNEVEERLEGEILERLDSWKNYLDKEQRIRKQAGLTRGPKLPFEWQESWEGSRMASNDDDDSDNTLTGPREPLPRRKQSDLRREINQMSLEALESLLHTADPARQQKIQSEIDFLKANMDDDFDPVFNEQDTPKGDESVNRQGPVDLTGLFRTSSSDPEFARDKLSRRLVDRVPAQERSSFPDETTRTNSSNMKELQSEARPAAPRTPFFSDAGFGNKQPAQTGKLGSMDDQKLNAMYRRAGARTQEEQEIIRQQWEEFRAIEDQQRQLYGLSSTSEDSSDLAAPLALSVSDALLEDGDIDAEKVLAAIGPRPKRNQKPKNPTITTDFVKPSIEKAVDQELASQANPTSVIPEDPEFDPFPTRTIEHSAGGSRSRRHESERTALSRPMGIDVSDVLGRRSSDDYADYKYEDDYIRRKQGGNWGGSSFDARKNMLLDYEELDITQVNAVMDHRDSVYTTGFSQYLPRINKPFREFGAIFRLEGVLVDVTGLHVEPWSKLARDEGYRIPTIDEIARASTLDPRDAIKQVFYWTDDFAETARLALAFRRERRAAFATISAREKESIGESGSVPPSAIEKAVVVDSPDVAKADENAVMEKYYRAWCATASKYGFDLPDPEEVLAASAIGDVDAVIRRGFGWTEDPFESAEMAESFRGAFAESMGVMNSRPEKKPENPAVNSRSDPNSDEKIYQIGVDAWRAVAASKGFDAPSNEQIMFAFSVGIEGAVSKAFHWSSDPVVIREIGALYEQEMRERRARLSKPAEDTAKVGSAVQESNDLFQVASGARRWISSLLQVDMSCSVVSHMDRDQVDYLLEKADLSDLIDQQRRVSADDVYKAETDQLLGAALRAERRPDHCVVFDSSPLASQAAHKGKEGCVPQLGCRVAEIEPDSFLPLIVSMQSVSIIGAYPRYELLSADATASGFDELTAMNIRRLFGERIYDQPELEVQDTKPEKRGKVATRTKFKYDD
jgi:beta-phosphoglucomutase-like phosphatase (HAD superfamily)